VPQRPSVVAFDVNETLSDQSPPADRFADLGLPGSIAKQWFAGLLRDNFALTAAGASEKFSVVGESVLRALLAPEKLDRDLDQAVQHVRRGFTALPVHPDVPDGSGAARSGPALTNGSTAVAEQLFAQAGRRAAFETLLSVDDAGAWKPDPVVRLRRARLPRLGRRDAAGRRAPVGHRRCLAGRAVHGAGIAPARTTPATSGPRRTRSGRCPSWPPCSPGERPRRRRGRPAGARGRRHDAVLPDRRRPDRPPAAPSSRHVLEPGLAARPAGPGHPAPLCRARPARLRAQRR